MIRVVLPYHLRTLAQVGSELALAIDGPVTQRSVLDALENAYPVLRGTIRDHITLQRRPLLRFFACEEDLSYESPDAPLPEAVASGKEPFFIIGAIAGGQGGKKGGARIRLAFRGRTLRIREEGSSYPGTARKGREIDEHRQAVLKVRQKTGLSRTNGRPRRLLIYRAWQGKAMRLVAVLFFVAVAVPAMLLAAEPPRARAPREALQAFNDLIGTWRGAGTPAGSREEQQRGFWSEKMTWQWHFQNKDAWIAVVFKDSKHFQSGALRYVPRDDEFQLTLETLARKTLTFTGRLKERVLTLQREDEKTKGTSRLVFTFLHPNRFLYRLETKAPAKVLFTRVFAVGATKEGEAFAAGDGRPECIVSGGLGTIPVVYKGTTYYVCCTGCRGEFKQDPEKYIKEFQQKKGRR